LPALLMNYAGQTALLIEYPDIGGNPFFRLAPDWAIIPLVFLATTAAIIASQAIVTGSFSLTRQAMQLGWFPGLKIRQTSAEEYGQIYVPFVNWTMMIATIGLTVFFEGSARLAAAYGTAVSMTMLLTTCLLYRAMRGRWGWPAPLALLTCGAFLVVDLAFFAANLLKITQGGWIPLIFGALVFTIMVVWRLGNDAVRLRLAAMTELPERFQARLKEQNIPRIPGTGVFLTRTNDAIPPIMVQHVAQLGVLPTTVIALAVRFEQIPRVASADRVQWVQVFDGFSRVTVHYGFMEVPDLPAALRDASAMGCPVDLEHAVFFGEHDDVIRCKDRQQLARWWISPFAFMFRNSVRAVDLFNLPPRDYVEVGREIEI
jgi:KUP system potassium uptake protein